MKMVVKQTFKMRCIAMEKDEIDIDNMFDRCLKALNLKYAWREILSIEESDNDRYLMLFNGVDNTIQFAAIDASSSYDEFYKTYALEVPNTVFPSTSTRNEAWGWLSKKDVLLDIFDSRHILFYERTNNDVSQFGKKCNVVEHLNPLFDCKLDETLLVKLDLLGV